MSELNIKKKKMKNGTITVCPKKVKIKVPAPDSCVASTDWMRRKNITSALPVQVG
jgi:hypothetical protein